MSLLTFTRAFISNSCVIGAVLLLSAPSMAGWRVKFDREATDMRGQKSRPFMLELETAVPEEPIRRPNSVPHQVIQRAAPSLRAPLPVLMPAHEISVIITDQGFAPSKLHLKRGESYQVTVVNVSGSHRNSSFVIPSLSVYEGVFFASPQTFQIQADQEGLFQFLSPESGSRGELVIYESPGGVAPSPSGPSGGPGVEAPSPLDPPGVVPLRIPTSAGRD